MNRFSLPGGRLAVTAVVTGALALGSAGGAVAATHHASTHSHTTTTHTHTTGAGISSLASSGIFKVVFGIFGAVKTQAPTIAAPIIADAVTATTITQAQGDQLTAMFSGKFTPPTAGSGSSFSPPSAGEIKVIGKIVSAIVAQLPTIAQGVLDKAVTNGDITQSQADLIKKVLTSLTSVHSKHTTTSH